MWDEEGRELFKTELGRVEIIEGKVQKIQGEFGTRMRENGKGRERQREKRGEEGKNGGMRNVEGKKERLRKKEKS